MLFRSGERVGLVRHQTARIRDDGVGTEQIPEALEQRVGQSDGLSGHGETLGGIRRRGQAYNQARGGIPGDADGARRGVEGPVLG